MKILYATDGRSPARQAARLLEAFGDRERADITVLSVAVTVLPSYRDDLALESAPVRLEAAKAIVDEAVEEFRDSGFPATGMTAAGSAPPTIVDIARDGSFDLVAVGAGHHSWLGAALLGSVSTHVLHASPTSVLVVHDRPVELPLEIVVGTDGSPAALNGIEMLKELADKERCRTHVLSVAPQTPPLMAFGPSVVAPKMAHDGDRRAQEELVRRARWFATDAERLLQDSGFSCDAAVGVGHAGQELLKETENRSANLVVVGSRGLGPVRRTLLGSVSDHVVRNAPAALVARRGLIVHS